jgi:hypothetical protein
VVLLPWPLLLVMRPLMKWRPLQHRLLLLLPLPLVPLVAQQVLSMVAVANRAHPHPPAATLQPRCPPGVAGLQKALQAPEHHPQDHPVLLHVRQWQLLPQQS